MEAQSKTGFLESSPGNFSNTRLLTWFGLIVTSLFTGFILVVSLLINHEPVTATVIASTTFWTTTNATFLVYAGHNKRQETKQALSNGQTSKQEA